MKTNVIFRGNSGYAMINGILEKVEFEDVVMYPNKILEYLDKEGKSLWNIKLYASKEDFEGDNEKEGENIILSDGYGYQETENGEEKIINTYIWKMGGGQPVRVLETLKFRRVYSNIFEPILKEGMYKSRVDCLKYNEYEYRAEDGSIQTKVGIGKKVQLTDEQRKFIDEELVGVLNKAKEMGIMLVLNNSTEYLYAANTKQLKEGAFDIDYSSDIDNDLDWINSDYFYKVPEQVLMMEGEETVYSE